MYTNDTVHIPLQYYQHLHQIASMMLPTLTAQQQTGSALTPSSPQSNTAAVTAAQSPAVTVSVTSAAAAVLPRLLLQQVYKFSDVQAYVFIKSGLYILLPTLCKIL